MGKPPSPCCQAPPSVASPAATHGSTGCACAASRAPLLPRPLLPLPLTGCLGAHDQGAHSVDAQVDKCEEELGEEADDEGGLQHSGQVDVAAVDALQWSSRGGVGCRVPGGRARQRGMAGGPAARQHGAQQQRCASSGSNDAAAAGSLLHPPTRPAPGRHPAGTHQEDVVVVVILPELYRHWDHQRQVAKQRQPLVVGRLLRRGGGTRGPAGAPGGEGRRQHAAAAHLAPAPAGSSGQAGGPVLRRRRACPHATQTPLSQPVRDADCPLGAMLTHTHTPPTNLEGQEVRDLVLRAKQVLVEGARHDVGHDPQLPPRPVAHSVGHGKLGQHHGDDLDRREEREGGREKRRIRGPEGQRVRSRVVGAGRLAAAVGVPPRVPAQSNTRCELPAVTRASADALATRQQQQEHPPGRRSRGRSHTACGSARHTWTAARGGGSRAARRWTPTGSGRTPAAPAPRRPWLRAVRQGGGRGGG